MGPVGAGLRTYGGHDPRLAKASSRWVGLRADGGRGLDTVMGAGGLMMQILAVFVLCWLLM